MKLSTLIRRWRKNMQIALYSVGFPIYGQGYVTEVENIGEILGVHPKFFALEQIADPRIIQSNFLDYSFNEEDYTVFVLPEPTCRYQGVPVQNSQPWLYYARKLSENNVNCLILWNIKPTPSLADRTYYQIYQSLDDALEADISRLNNDHLIVRFFD